MPPAGAVTGVTKIVDNGADVDHFVLVVTGDGFTAAEQSDFEGAVDDFLVALQATAPYSDPAVFERINVYRMTTESTESGADNPPACGDDADGFVPTPPEDAETYYQSSYCHDATRRLLEIADVGQLMADLDANVTAWDGAVVLVNHDEYGGSGDGFNGIAVCSLTGTDIGIHEFGHALGLADEYDDLHDTWPGGEPDEPNVTADASGAKWGSSLTAAALPTWQSADCTVSNDGVPDPEPGAVGTYEGGARYRCGVFRPTNDCKMRHLGVPFCVVCEAHIREVLDAPFHVGPQSSQCFVASAVYGDLMHPDVVALRDWRDRSLAPDARGRPLMRVLAGGYRVVGPPAARFTRSRPRLARALRRYMFAPLVRALRS